MPTTPWQFLAGFLADNFSALEQRELVRRLPKGTWLARQLPGEPLSRSVFAFTVADLLEKEGRVDAALIEVLADAAREARRPDLEEVARAWGLPMPPRAEHRKEAAGGTDTATERLEVRLSGAAREADSFPAARVYELRELDLSRSGWEERMELIPRIPGLVGDLEIAVLVLEELREKTTHGADLFWIWWTLRGLAGQRALEVGGGDDGIRVVRERAGEPMRARAILARRRRLGRYSIISRATELERLPPSFEGSGEKYGRRATTARQAREHRTRRRGEGWVPKVRGSRRSFSRRRSTTQFTSSSTRITRQSAGTAAMRTLSSM